MPASVCIATYAVLLFRSQRVNDFHALRAPVSAITNIMLTCRNRCSALISFSWDRLNIIFRALWLVTGRARHAAWLLPELSPQRSQADARPYHTELVAPETLALA